MALNTSYDPRNILDFEKSKLNKSADAIFQVVDKGTTTNIDMILTDDSLLAGGSVLLAKNVKWGDYVSFEVSGVHPTLGQITTEFIKKWYLNPDKIEQILPTSNYPAKIAAGFTLRAKYYSVATESDLNPEVAINYNLEKVLV